MIPAHFGPEQARSNMHLLLLANPNYFGNLGDSAGSPVLQIAADTTYEQLDCVGFSTALGRLEAVISINQSAGYNGGLCAPGSQEFVRFYLSTDNGATWQDQGVVSCTVHDAPGPKPLNYAVALPVTVPEYFCFFENMPLVRAILSWNYAPPANMPGYVPVWGNVVEVAVQIPSSDFILFAELLEKSKVQLPEALAAAIDTSQPIAVKPPKQLAPADLIALYRDEAVPHHRILYPQIASLSLNHAVNASAASVGAVSELTSLGVDWGSLVNAVLVTSGDTAFEQLTCVGLDQNRSALTAVVNVKQSSGFNGGPCTLGSNEYVAFWVDWGSGLTYAGTASIPVHDFAGIPAGGLNYAAVLPINLASHQLPCTEGLQTATVRAILSWETPPPPADPAYVPVWGNQLEAQVALPAGQPFVAGTPDIAIIGGIGIASIDVTGVTAHRGMTLPGALFSLTGTYADPWISTRACAFGGQIVIQGQPTVGNKYSVWVQKLGAPSPIQLTDPIYVTDYLGNGSWVAPDGDGYFSYLDPSQNIDQVLAYWYSSGDDLYNVWLDLADTSGTVLASTPNYLIPLDNTAPAAAIHIDNGGDCKQFGQGATISGHFVATDLHFGAFSLDTTPATLNPPAPSTATPSTSPTAAAPGDSWTLDTAGMPTCGYVVQLWVYDNTIVGSSPGSHNSDYADVGFCLIAD